AFGEARRPVPDRHQLEPAVVLEALDHGAQRIEVGHDGPGGPRLLAAQSRPYLAAARELDVDAEVLELVGDMMDNRIRVTGRARDAQQPFELRQEIAFVDLEAHRQPAVAESAARRAVAGIVCGKSRSMKRCAVGCGSWLASPGRSLASMNAQSDSRGHRTLRSAPPTALAIPRAG